MPKRLAVFVLALGLCFLLTEGVLSLCFDRSWWTPLREQSFLESLIEPEIQTDADRFAAAVGSPGPYRIHEDPLVSYVLKSDQVLEMGGYTAHSNDLGLRRRPQGEPPETAFRVIVLGDSLAFGKGLSDEEVLAVRLEELLNAGGAPGAVEIACHTVAIPSWNTRNALQFVRDHFDRLSPDLVLYLSVPNDLEDSSGVWETGHRRRAYDLSARRTRVQVGENLRYFRRSAARLLRAEANLDDERIGPAVIDAGLTRTSEERLEGLAVALVEFRAWLAERGAPLILVPFEQHTTHRQLRARLASMGESLPAIPLLDRLLATDSQADDPHPSAETTRSFAVWLARALVEEGWVPAAQPEAWPEVEPRHRGRRGRELTDAEALAWSRDHGASTRSLLQPEIRHETVRGMRQIYGGIRWDGTMGPELVAVLPAGRELRVELAPLPTRPDLYPLRVLVFVDEEPLGELEVAAPEGSAGGMSAAQWPLPAASLGRPFEVRLEAETWCVVSVVETSHLASVLFGALVSIE